MNNSEVQIFFENYLGEKPSVFFALPQSGSSRVNYIAEVSKEKFIITYNENLRENEAFFYFSEVFSHLNLNTPKIFKINKERTLYIQEFLGNETLSEVIEKEGLSERVKSLVKKTLEKLYELQQKTEGKIDFTKTFEYEIYDELPITNDLFYFKNFMIDVLEIPYHKSTLLKEFMSLTQKIENLQPKVLMIRDFQARNIMVKEDEVFFIDYQAAMQGPAMYDVVSFLFQAKANFPENFKNEMLEYYFSLYKDEKEKIQLKTSVKYIQLIRFMQVLGAYGFRGLIQRKSHFLNSINQGIKNLVNLSENWEEMNQYPELKKLISELNTSKNKIKKLIDGQ